MVRFTKPAFDLRCGDPHLRTEPLDFVDGTFDAVPIYPDGANSGGTILYWILYVFAEFVPLIGSLDSQGTPVEQSPQP